MTDAALENALARKDALAERMGNLANQINELLGAWERARGDLENVNEFIRTWHDMAGIPLPKELEQIESDAPVETGKRIRPKNPRRKDVAIQCVRYIHAAGRPLSRRELFDELAREGIEIRGKDPEMVLSTMLWRSKDIIRRLPEGGYWPAGEKTPSELALDELMGTVNVNL